ncbi:MAG: MBL fold metallo-hydrolase [Candidatus Krumholzibacteria bacterium]|nr:MBL fold metallo-hydrolase [Candidatus Krumholzibacteria bacterium]MDH4337083.1 MBL fold metallo-hydrolase [Candidatus Krumholzibacteria bacterium]MDH5268620.1 MBL fold metallo-hydrolase [Candidatus Krumholzibacteria bacterium]MDH5627958.1 MBL fold metallo-hydrolase [Candidatus Krumholzibacteria bacterium]
MFRIESLVVGPFQSNCHIVACGETGEAVIFDAGDEAPRILAAVEEMGVTVKAVVNTHAHLDHVAGLAGVVDALGVPVFMHRADEPVYQAVGPQAQMFGLPVPRTVPIQRWLEEGDTVNIGNLRGEVMLMPGHTPGHIIVLFVGETPPRVVVGDVLFQGSIGRTDLPGGDHETMMRTLERFLPMADDTVVHCGHGPDTTIGEEKRWNPFLAPIARRG